MAARGEGELSLALAARGEPPWPRGAGELLLALAARVSCHGRFAGRALTKTLH
jgi:hypothetical protein